MPLLVNGQTISTIAGKGFGVGSGDGGPATSAFINYPTWCAFDSKGNLFLTTGAAGKAVRKIDPSGKISTIAGTIGIGGYSGNGGTATAAKFNNPQGIAIDAFDNVYIADAQSHVIRKIDATSGIISTFAGNGTPGYTGDGGVATSAQLFNPNGICFDKMGNLYVADYSNYVIRKVNPLGVISTFAGTGVSGYNGDGGLADTSRLRGAFDVCADVSGNVYIADESNGRIRKVDGAGIITTIAGIGIALYSGDGGPATAAEVAPHTITRDQLGNIYMSDLFQDRVRVINTSGVIATIAGNGTAGFSGDGGPSTTAQLHDPAGITTDICGNLYICEVTNYRIRKVASGTTITPTISITSGTSYASGSTVKVTAAVTDTCVSYLVRWFNKGVLFATTTTTSVTYTKGAGIDTITARVVPQCGSCYDSTTSSQHIVYNSALGINGTALQPVYIYPNPAKSELSITAGSYITGVSISNIIGRQVYSHEYSSQNVSVNIAHLPPGVYAVRIIGDGWQEVKRVVKE